MTRKSEPILIADPDTPTKRAFIKRDTFKKVVIYRQKLEA